MTTRHFATVLSLSLALLTTSARAQTSARACVAASEEGQRLRDERKLKEAREQFLICMKDACPGIVRKDCADWFSQVEAAMSSVVPIVKVCGKDAIDVKVMIDGKPVADKLDGRAIPVAPGPHNIAFEVIDKEGKPKTIEEKVLVSEGQRSKQVSVAFDSPLVDCGSAAAPEKAEPSESSAQSFPIGPVIVGSLGLTAIVIGAVLDAQGFSEYNDKRDDLEKTCVVNGQKVCTQAQVDDALDPPKSTMLLGEVILGAGIATLGAAAIWYFVGDFGGRKANGSATAPPSKHYEQVPRLSVNPVREGGIVSLSARF